MGIITIIFIALGLAMDAFAVSVVSGITIKGLKTSHALRIGLFFGGFQALMPVVGWLTGLGLKNFIFGFDHWIAFGLLSFIGVKMIYESNRIDKDRRDPLGIYNLLILAIATSIDALAVGVTFAFLSVSIIIPVVIIGIITFILSFFGTFIGNRIGHFCERKIEVAGGLVLIIMGIKILTEHLIR